MKRTTTHIQDASWRSGVARVRTHSCSTVLTHPIANVYLAKPAYMTGFANAQITRRGVPPQ